MRLPNSIVTKAASLSPSLSPNPNTLNTTPKTTTHSTTTPTQAKNNCQEDITNLWLNSIALASRRNNQRRWQILWGEIDKTLWIECRMIIRQTTIWGKSSATTTVSMSSLSALITFTKTRQIWSAQFHSAKISATMSSGSRAEWRLERHQHKKWKMRSAILSISTIKTKQKHLHKRLRKLNQQMKFVKLMMSRICSLLQAETSSLTGKKT